MLLEQVLLLLQPNNGGSEGYFFGVVLAAPREVEVAIADVERFKRFLGRDRPERVRGEHGIEAWDQRKGLTGAVHPNPGPLLLAPDHNRLVRRSDDCDHVEVAFVGRGRAAEIDAAENQDLDSGEVRLDGDLARRDVGLDGSARRSSARRAAQRKKNGGDG